MLSRWIEVGRMAVVDTGLTNLVVTMGGDGVDDS